MNLSPETVNSLPSIVESFDPIKVDATKRVRYVSIPVTLTVFSIVGTGIAIASVKMGLGLAGLCHRQGNLTATPKALHRPVPDESDDLTDP